MRATTRKAAPTAAIGRADAAWQWGGLGSNSTHLITAASPTCRYCVTDSPCRYLLNQPNQPMSTVHNPPPLLLVPPLANLPLA
jgi:hypothetical protein